MRRYRILSSKNIGGAESPMFLTSPVEAGIAAKIQEGIDIAEVAKCA
jgi:hypothetical protein